MFLLNFFFAENMILQLAVMNKKKYLLKDIKNLLNLPKTK